MALLQHHHQQLEEEKMQQQKNRGEVVFPAGVDRPPIRGLPCVQQLQQQPTHQRSDADTASHRLHRTGVAKHK